MEIYLFIFFTLFRKKNLFKYVCSTFIYTYLVVYFQTRDRLHWFQISKNVFSHKVVIFNVALEHFQKLDWSREYIFSNILFLFCEQNITKKVQVKYICRISRGKSLPPVLKSGSINVLCYLVLKAKPKSYRDKLM